MKKNQILKFWAILLLYFIATGNNFAQTSDEKKYPYTLGTSSEFLHTLESQLAQKATNPQLQLVLPNSEALNGKVNFKKGNSSSEIHIEGEILNRNSGNFSIMIKDNKLEGRIVLLNDRKAYTYYSDRNGNAFIRETDINEVVCIDFLKFPATKEKNTGYLKQESKNINVSNLQSFPGAGGCLLLDFDGHTVAAGSGWNGGNPIIALPSGMANDQILEAWEIAAEDFRPFNLNVTTNETVFNSYPQNKRRRCVVTPTDIAYPGSAGFALINSFSSMSDLPCWAFTLVAGTSGKIIGEICSHELGHTLGLSHDGQSQYSYYSGHGDWAPIMGVGYYRPVTQWSKAEYSNGTNHQDDLSIIASASNGIGYRNDNAGDTFATAVPLNIINGQIPEIQGIIEKTEDIDMFSFDAPGGNISLKITAASRHSDLLLKVTLYDSNHAEINTFKAISPNLGQPINMNVNLKTGKYFLAVTSISEGTPDTGFTTYASLGYYGISGVFGNLSTKAYSISSLEAYPNPVEDELTIKPPSDKEKYQIDISDVSGHKIYSSVLSGKTITIPFSEQQPAIYLVLVKNMTTGEEKTFKIIKK